MTLKSGRAAHIGFAAADHALRRGPGVRLRRGCTSAIFEVGHDRRFAPPEPRFGADRKLRQSLGDIVDRAERMQRTCCGKTDFVDARRDRRFDIFATPGPGIPLPIAPGRNHCRSPTASKGAIIFKIRSGGVDLCRDLNVLLQKSFLRLLSGSTYRELAGRSPTRQANPPQITASVAVQSRPAWPDPGSSS